MSKIIQSGMLDIDIEQIVNSTNNLDYRRTYSVVLHTPEDDINIQLLHNIEWTRDYNSSGEDVRAIFIMDGALYRNFVYKQRDHLQITIHKWSGESLLSTNRYKFLLLSTSEDLNDESMNVLTDKQLQNFSPIRIEGQCVDMDLYSLVDIKIGSIYNKANVKDVMITEFLENLKNIDYGEGTPDISIDIKEPNNDNIYNRVLLPTGTDLMLVPNYLQEHETYGVYNAGIGNFIQSYKNKKYYWIYPLFDLSQYDKAENTLMLYHSTHRRVGISGTTFLIDGKITKIIPEYKVEVLERAERPLIEEGTNITYLDPINLYKSLKGTPNGSIEAKVKNNVNTIRNKDMKDGSNKSIYIGATNNVYKHRTEALLKTMSTYKLNWHNCDIDLIYPAMPCVFLQEDNKTGIMKLKGSVRGTYQRYQHDTKETTGSIIISVASPKVYMDMDDYEDMNIKSKN